MQFVTNTIPQYGTYKGVAEKYRNEFINWDYYERMINPQRFSDRSKAMLICKLSIRPKYDCYVRVNNDKNVNIKLEAQKWADIDLSGTIVNSISFDKNMPYMAKYEY